jgi:cytochrome c oxidase subunit 2
VNRGVKLPPSRPLAVRAALAALVAPLGGCAWDGPMSTVVANSDVARSTLSVYALITWVTSVIGLLVLVVLGVILVRFRAKPGAPLPAQIRGHTLMELGWTIMPALVLLVIAIPTIQVIFRTQGAAEPPNALHVTVRGWQWWWEFRYPTLDVVTANELHLPAGRPVVLTLEGPDVIHSFWVPHLGGKRDVVPGRHNRITLTPDRPGEHWGQCAEFCGASHANMGLRVIVEPAADFDAWVARQKAPPAEPAGPAAEGKAIFAKSACVGCHTIQGVSAGVLGPNLTHFGGRTMLAAGMWPNTPDNVTAWVRDPQRLKPGAKMPDLGLTEAQAKAVAAYLTELK